MLKIAWIRPVETWERGVLAEGKLPRVMRRLEGPPLLKNNIIKYTRMRHFKKKNSKMFSPLAEGPRENVSPVRSGSRRAWFKCVSEMSV